MVLVLLTALQFGVAFFAYDYCESKLSKLNGK